MARTRTSQALDKSDDQTGTPAAAGATGVEDLPLDEFKRLLVAGSFPVYANVATAMADMQFVQADPMRAPARAQDLCLRQRISSYAVGDLETSFPELDLEEGYLFAYGFMLPRVWQSLHGQQQTKKLTAMEKNVLAAVKEMGGDVRPKDLDERFGSKSKTNYWGGKSKVTKTVLDDLHSRGLLRVSRRRNGERLYQVARTIAPCGTATDRFCHLVLTTVHVFGPTTRSFLMSELKYKGSRILAKRQDRDAAITSLLASGKLQQVRVEDVMYVWIRKAWQKQAVPERVRILAPFDPLVRDRARFEQLWGWPYRLEAYVPVAKRKRGYYAMPLLWKADVIGWANAHVKNSRLSVDFGYVGKRPPREKSFRPLAEAEVEAMTVFLGLEPGAWELK